MCGCIIVSFCCLGILAILTVLILTSIIPYEFLCKMIFEYIIWPYTGYMIAGIPMVIIEEEHRSHTILSRFSKKYYRMVGVYCLGIGIVFLEYSLLNYINSYLYIPWFILFSIRHFKTSFAGILLAFPNTVFHREKLERIFIMNMLAFYLSYRVWESSYSIILG
jgi:hypothetical protein